MNDARVGPVLTEVVEPLTAGQRELALRAGSGLVVRLVWDITQDHVYIDVIDQWENARFVVRVPKEKALHAFHHPYAYLPDPPAVDSAQAA